ncbi:MAG: hypothetical protein H7A50_13580 [Akkermansiaceae bacterium]|nr:hypothetical protein [Akkermansiaceae bacterium]
MSTMTPPSARSPFTEPSGHCFVRAGSNEISPACDWSNISANPFRDAEVAVDLEWRVGGPEIVEAC